MKTAITRSLGRRRPLAVGRSPCVDQVDQFGQVAQNEQVRAGRYPLSRWYLRPMAGRLAAALEPTRVRPVHLTTCGLLAGMTAAAVLCLGPGMAAIAGVLVLVWWFFDRADGQLARRQRTVSTRGAWFDANADELVDIAVHVALASAAARGPAASPVAWSLLIAFLAGKYLLMHGLWTDEFLQKPAREQAEDPRHKASACPTARCQQSPWTDRLRTLYHLPGNADIRAHLLAVGLLTGWLTAELAVVAVYYNVRWTARYVLLARRRRGSP